MGTAFSTPSIPKTSDPPKKYPLGKDPNIQYPDWCDWCLTPRKKCGC